MVKKEGSEAKIRAKLDELEKRKEEKENELENIETSIEEYEELLPTEVSTRGGPMVKFHN